MKTFQRKIIEKRNAELQIFTFRTKILMGMFKIVFSGELSAHYY